MERKPLPEEIIQVLDIKRGMKILDFGCGRGRYTLPLARIVGSEGRIYALDREKGELEKLRDEIQRWKL
ncbi:MAG TPA: methyltransferase domain-containing protein, partial [Candidatus Omnitrophica bacterium]|nr:methyltransferase domain-containing protein [Candidatus Omnitrophota bacterium]